MTGGTLQGSPLSPSLFTIYMSAMVRRGEELDRQRHQKFREGKANAAFQLVRRLTRLPPRKKKKVVVSQLMAILTYGAEPHSKPSEQGRLLGAEWNRFVTGGWRGSSRERLAGIAGIAEVMRNKRIGWAVSIYERGVEELRESAREIFKHCLEENTILRWPRESRDRIEHLED